MLLKNSFYSRLTSEHCHNNYIFIFETILFHVFQCFQNATSCSKCRICDKNSFTFWFFYNCRTMSLLEVYHICISNSTLYTSYNLYFLANSQRKHQVQTRHFDRKSTQNATSFHLAIETVLLGVLACFSSAFLAVRRLQTDRKSGLVQKISHTALLMGFFQSAEIGVLFTEQCQSLSQAGIVGVDTGCVLALIKEDDSFFFILRQLRHNFSPCDDSSSYP